MSWLVQLGCDPTDLSALAQSLTGPEFSISHDGQQYVLASSHFNAGDDAKTVREKAVQFTTMLSGAARLALDAQQSIQVGAVFRNLPDGKREIFAFLEPGVIRFRAMSPTVKVTHANGTEEVFHPADPIVTWLPAALADKAIADVLALIAGGVLDWVNLYRVFEIVEADTGGIDKIVANDWATKTSMRLFKHTANSPGAIGLDARHGTQSAQPPAAPMSLSEARSLINAIIHAWLRAKTASP